MAVFHLATSTPTKAEILGAWIPRTPWGGSRAGALEIIDSFRFDDPEGEVGLETHIVAIGDTVLQVPLTYRAAALAGVEPIATMEHSVLGTRYVYDGVHDDCYVMALCGATLTGQGESLGWASHEGRWYAVPTSISLAHRGPRVTEPVAVNGLRIERDDIDSITFRRGRLSLTFHRVLRLALDDDAGLTAEWSSSPGPVLLATAVRQPG